MELCYIYPQAMLRTHDKYADKKSLENWEYRLRSLLLYALGFVIGVSLIVGASVKQGIDLGSS